MRVETFMIVFFLPGREGLLFPIRIVNTGLNFESNDNSFHLGWIGLDSQVADSRVSQKTVFFFIFLHAFK